MTNTNDLTVFNFQGEQVRIVMIDGNPWFIANDLCSILGHTNSRKALALLDSDDVTSSYVIDSLGRSQKTNIISEAGMYLLVLRSRLDSAKPFQRWVTSEVLPSIRKTGSYGTPVIDTNQQILMMLAQTMQTLTGKTTEHFTAIDTRFNAIEPTIAKQADQLAAVEAKLADTDLLKRQQLRAATEAIKEQVFKAMTGRGMSVQKVASEFWNNVKGRSGISSVKVECLTVEMARKLYAEAQRQAKFWEVGVVVPMTLDLEASPGQ